MSALLSLSLVAWAAVALLMLVLWAVHLRTGNAAIVDVGWSFGLPVAAGLYAWLGPDAGIRSSLLALMFLVWGVRLGVYLLVTRILGQPEEGRYAELRRRWRTNLPRKFLLFFQAQAALDILLSLPALLVARDSTPTLGAVHLLGLALWGIGVVGETVADVQLQAFKQRAASRGAVCDAGLWRYSRHPNYFFEWIVWLGYAVFAAGSPWGWVAIACPAAMLFFLFRITGIPATEAQALRSRGDAYRRYQRATSVFVPWRPRSLAP